MSLPRRTYEAFLIPELEEYFHTSKSRECVVISQDALRHLFDVPANTETVWLTLCREHSESGQFVEPKLDVWEGASLLIDGESYPVTWGVWDAVSAFLKRNNQLWLWIECSYRANG